MPTNQKLNENDIRIRAKTSDQNLLALAKRIAVAYGDDSVRLLSVREVEKAMDMHDIDAVNKIIANVPQMSAGQRLDFCDAFVGEDMSGLDLATPMILGEAYRAIAARVRNGEENQQERLDRITARIDDLSADFANSGGMVVGQNEWPLVDTNNFADTYEGFANMFDARLADFDSTANSEKYAEMQRNIQYIETVVSEYDNAWGLRNLQQIDASKLAERWDELYAALNRAELSEETKTKLAKYKFLDSKGAVIPQFTSGKRGDTKKYEEYEPGFRIAKDGRLASVVELARHDVAKRHVADFESGVDEDSLESELNEQVLYKLFEIDNADKIVQGATENPEQFADPKYREEFINNLAQAGGKISDVGYNAAIDAQTNATAGWAARVKNKLGVAAEKASGFFARVFNPIKHIDKMADVRMTRRSIDKREKRIELLTRILKGFLSGLVASALITTIATAAAAAAGMSVAMSLAAISIVTAIGMGVIQVMRWRKAQEAAGLPTDINEFFKDRRLVASLGASLFAVVAMCFGAGGMAMAAKWLGYGALAIGGSNNAAAAFRDARDAKMSAAESIAWAIANAGAVIGGGFAGRAAAHAGINAINKHYSHNTWFQNETPRAEAQENATSSDVTTPQESDQIADATETRLEYTQDALDNAERISRMWYRDNPEILQQRVDAINAYNAENGTNIDPYRAIMINGDAGGRTFDNMRLHVNNSHIDSNINDVYSRGSHRVLTDAWGRANGFSHDELNAARHLFGRDGSINPNGMDVIAKLDNIISDNNTVGYVQGRPVFTDNYFKSNDPSGWTTYTGGNAPKIENVYPVESVAPTPKEVVPSPKPVEYIDRIPAQGDGMAAFGNYTPRERLTKLRDRVGSFLDRVRRNRQNESVSEDVSPVIRNDEPKDEVPQIVLDERDEKLRIPEERKSPARREYVAPEISLDRVFPKPFFDDDKGRLAELREKSQPQPDPIPQWRIEDMPTALPDPENRKYEPLSDFAFAMTEDQAERWNDLHKQLATVRAEMRNSFTRADKMLKLRKQANRLTNEINSFAMELGNPSAFEIEQALAEVDRRKKLQNLLKQYENHMRREPKGSDTQDWQLLKWDAERQKLLDKITALGGADSLDESNLRFAAPTLGRLEQKRADVAQREKERQEQKHDVFVMPMREQPKQVEERRSTEPEEKKQDTNVSSRPFDFEHQKPDFGNRYPRNKRLDIDNHTMPQPVLKFQTELPGAFSKSVDQHIGSRSLMDVRGVPVQLMDLTGNGDMIVQNKKHAMVVVDVDGLRIPFFLANGNEGSNQIVPGNWYPVFTLSRDGTWFFGPTIGYVEQSQSKDKKIRQSNKIRYLSKIASTLNEWIGDIRNYRDERGTAALQANGQEGFVGGFDAVPQVDSNHVANIVEHQPNTYKHYDFWNCVGKEAISLYPPYVKWYFNQVRAPGYTDDQEKDEYREERREKRQENREYRQNNRYERRQKFVLGVGGILNQVRGRLFGWDEDSKEYE